MQEKDLIEQLKQMQNVQPNKEWKDRDRAGILEYVYGARQTMEPGAFSWTRVFVSQLPVEVVRGARKPVVAFGVLVLLLFGGGLVSLGAAQDAKPGDSLYIAKRATEKTKLAFTFNEQEKARLGLQFAGNRAAEIGRILEEAQKNEEQREETVDELVENFKSELDSVKLRLQKMSEKQAGESEPEAGPGTDTASEPEPAQTGDGDREEPEESPEDTESPSDSKIAQQQAEEDEPEASGEDSRMFSAGLDKEDKGVQISGGDTQTEEKGETTDAEQTDGVPAAEEGIDRASTTVEKFLEENPLEKVGDTQELLKQAAELLNGKDYEALIDKLDEAGETLSGVSTDEEDSTEGEVKGESEAATSTDEAATQAATTTQQADEQASTSEETTESR